MGKKKSASQSQTTNTYGFMQAPENLYYKAAEAQIGEYDGGASQIISDRGRAANEIRNSGNEFLGSSTNDEVRQKTMDNRIFRNTVDKGKDLQAAGQNAAAYKNSAYMSLGGATAPQLVQTGGTQNSTATQSGGVLAGMANTATAVGTQALMA